MPVLKSLFRERSIHAVFDVSVAIKGLDGLLEVLGSILLFIISPQKIGQVIVSLTQHELSHDPHDLIANHLSSFAQNFSAHTQIFAALYLLSHGLVKIFLVWGLLKNKLWAYPASIAFLLGYIIYQIYRYNSNHAVSLILLSIFDAFIVLLTW